ncbi:MAG: N-acetylneuraminate synthase family protein [Planctomycetaceae bacterium]|nr:N-acetylneuraminate synthase family protein [Planctomycetaceae bacterium]
MTVQKRIPKVVAEIGGNHRGSVETAKEMIMMAAQFCKVDVVKFQKRCIKECLTPQEYNAPHPNPANSYGDTYGKHREFLEFDVAIHRDLKAVCESYGVIYSSSVWDLTSAREIISLDPKLIKVPSACNTWDDLLAMLCQEYSGEIHIALGMTTRKEEEHIVDFINRHDRLKDTVVYHCTSGYPVPFENLYLQEIQRLIETYGGTVKAIGYSGHHNGIGADIAAFTLGADWVERHFTLDRTWKGTDHAASLEPDGMRRVVRNNRQIADALQRRPVDIAPIELPQRKKLKWNRSSGEARA